jgi:hypothetical protein
MIWKLTPVPLDTETHSPQEKRDGRFVLHRHHDGAGPHLDLRLEMDGYLMGWRIDALNLDAEVLATEKAPHPPDWLDQDGDAIREDEGNYRWLSHTDDGGELILCSQQGTRHIRVEREEKLSPSMVRDLLEVLRKSNVSPEKAAALITDGLVARRHAVERFCGLGRELDGSAFEEQTWRVTLASRSLADIQQHLRAYEVRFDQKFPPQSTSQPETLAEVDSEVRSGHALDICMT